MSIIGKELGIIVRLYRLSCDLFLFTSFKLSKLFLPCRNNDHITSWIREYKVLLNCCDTCSSFMVISGHPKHVLCLWKDKYSETQIHRHLIFTKISSVYPALFLSNKVIRLYFGIGVGFTWTQAETDPWSK